MERTPSEIYAVLSQFNFWWRRERLPQLPAFQRASFGQFQRWVIDPPAPRAVLLSGARQVGKTTLIFQSIYDLLARGVPPGNILYATFDHPILKMAGIDQVLEAWRRREPRVDGREYLFLDEAQFIANWGTWIKHQVDFQRDRRVIFTGSVMPLLETDQESGVGRWHTIRLAPLSFYEYLRIRKTNLPALPQPATLDGFARLDPGEILDLQSAARHYVAHFHEYLVRGGFPQTAQMEDIVEAQRLLREDILDKVLRRDMTALFGVRRVLDLEHTFVYLCLHDGGLLDMPSLCQNLEVKRPTAQHFIELLESVNLIHRLEPYGYGKEVLRARYKIYLADAALAPSIMLTGKELIDNPTGLGIACETAVFRHIWAHYTPQHGRVTYWRRKQDREVDLVAALGERLTPFEVKYRQDVHGPRDLKGLLELCAQKQIPRGYAVTKSINDFGPVDGTPIFRIPAPVLCYWLGAAEALTN